ncbi:MAG TPA: glycoside hydrolase family 15 protein [Acidimicrobiales bacterium]|nr:glycoside hydrolase family 15 protein [Acidimicrobiales bacterium]
MATRRTDGAISGRAPEASRSAEFPSELRAYAFIADGLRGALVSPGGDISWLCFPSWSDPALFAGLVGSGGCYRVQPEGRFVPGGYYEDDSLIWRSRWVAADGTVECREALVYPATAERAILLRRISTIRGRGSVTVLLAPSGDYGRRALPPWRREGECWVLRDGDLALRWSGGAEARAARAPGGERALRLHLELARGESHDLALEICSAASLEREPANADECWRRTETAWREALAPTSGVVASRDVRRSIAVLRGMTGPDGATVAGATTSLPERAGAGRNYDYRYTWIRDTCYVGHAGAALAGGEELLDGAVRWVARRLLEDGEHTSPAYLANGDPIPAPSHLALAGYPGGSDVVGNRAREQFQLDIFGESLLLFAEAARKERLDSEGWQAAKVAADAIASRWKEHEAGLWEIEPNRWAHSQLIGVAGLRAIAAAATNEPWTARALPLADHLLDEANASCLHPSGRWQRAPDDEHVDASLLLAEVRGALPPSDPRSIATRRAIGRDLSSDGYLYRFSFPGHRLGEDEGSFLICNFWMSLACIGVGELPEGVRWFERARAACSTSGLFSEEYDVEQHQLRGNLPQAFVHALFIEAAAAQEPQE